MFDYILEKVLNNFQPTSWNGVPLAPQLRSARSFTIKLATLYINVPAKLNSLQRKLCHAELLARPNWYWGEYCKKYVVVPV